MLKQEDNVLTREDREKKKKEMSQWKKEEIAKLKAAIKATAHEQYRNRICKLYDGNEKIKAVLLDENVCEALDKFIDSGNTHFFDIVEDKLSWKGNPEENQRVLESCKDLFGRKNLGIAYAENINEAIERAEQNSERMQSFPGALETTKNSLATVKVAGNDPHHNGKRVVFLTFKKSANPQGCLPLFVTSKRQQFTVVYKPSDLSPDNLLVGQESVLSLMQSKLPKENLMLKNTKLPSFNFVTLNNHSGFMEFLSHEKDDYTLTSEEKQQYFYVFGLEAAMCVTFGIDDRHTENILASRKLPHLIDLETSFSTHVKSIQQTLIVLQDVGSLIPPMEPPAGADFDCNSLVKNKHNKKLVPSLDDFGQGLQDGMKILAEHADEFLRLLETKTSSHAPFLVRFLPADTSALKSERAYYNSELLAETKTYSALKNPLISENKRNFVNLANNMDNPDLLAKTDVFKFKCLLTTMLNFECIERDMARLDIPAFYVDIRTGQMYDSEFQPLATHFDQQRANEMLALMLTEKKMPKEELSALVDEMLHLIQNATPPLEKIKQNILHLKEEYLSHNKDINKCKVFMKSRQETAFLLKSNNLPLHTPVKEEAGPSLTMMKKIIMLCSVPLSFLVTFIGRGED